MPPKDNSPATSNANSQLGPFELVSDKLSKSSNVLVTVSSSPSLDQLSACLGLTLVLNKMGKHATAVFSGKIPSAIEFLKPEKTIEKNTDSLRDFIIALDKSKADKLRYKVEDDVVRIFITPYKTSITEDDLKFSQGDFNVDAVLAIGVKDRSHLDAAITAHGRILHDATVMCLNTKTKSEFAAIDWVEPRASSLSEMVADIVLELKKDALDSQISTALLTGVVAETDRFRNEKVSPHTMSISGVLMASGASTQLVATKLEDAKKAELLEKQKNELRSHKPADDGAIRIKHSDEHEKKPKEEVAEDLEPAIEQVELPEENPEEKDNIHIDEQGSFKVLRDEETLDASRESDKPEEKPSNMATHPPRFGGQLTANSVPQDRVYSGTTDPLSSPTQDGGLISQDPHSRSVPDNPKENQTLNDIEKSVNSPHLDVDQAREAASIAADNSEPRPEANQSIGSHNVELEGLGQNSNEPESNGQTPSSPPPPVPPPMMPPSTT